MPEPADSFLEPTRPPVRPSLRDHVAALTGGAAGPRLLGAVVGLVAVAAVAVVLWPRPASPAPELVLPRASTTVAAAIGPTTSTAPVDLVVDVVGEVRRAGVYRVAAGARIVDAIDAAGGLTPQADRARVNLAAPVSDGERIFVPAVGQQVPAIAVGGQPAGPPAGTPGATGGGVGQGEPVNINTASLEELDTLPGVGPATAQAIIDHRTQNGPFASVDELLDVRGIGDAKLAELRDHVAV